MNKKNEEMIYSIKSKILCGVYTPNEKLPSLRALMKEYQLSMNSCYRGIEHLIERGFLETRHGSGTFVKDNKNTQKMHKIHIISIDFLLREKNCFTGVAWLGIKKNANPNNVMLIHSTYKSEDLKNRKILENISKNSDGIIFLGGYDEFLQVLKIKVPVVGLHMHKSFDGNFSIVDMDPIHTAEICCDFFEKQNKKKVYVILDFERENFRFIKQLFTTKFSGEVIFDKCNPKRKFDPEYGYLYLVSSEAQNELKNNSENLPNNIAILSVGLSLKEQIHIPSITINWQNAGVVALEECIRRISYPSSEARRIYLTPKIYK